MSFQAKAIRDSILLLALAFFSACSAYQPIPLGELPVAEAPTRSTLLEAKSDISEMLRQTGYEDKSSAKGNERFYRVYDRLTKSIGGNSNQWPLYIIDGFGETNAGIYKNSVVLLYSDLGKKLTSDEEIAVVLAHELGHLSARHSNKEAFARGETAAVAARIIGGAVAVGTAIAGLDADSANLAGGAAALVGVIGAHSTFIAPHLKAQEYDADKLGMMIMGKAAYHPEAAIKFWQSAKERFDDSGWLQFISSHPSGEDRAEALKEALPYAMKYYTEENAAISANASLPSRGRKGGRKSLTPR